MRIVKIEAEALLSDGDVALVESKITIDRFTTRKHILAALRRIVMADLQKQGKDGVQIIDIYITKEN